MIVLGSGKQLHSMKLITEKTVLEPLKNPNHHLEISDCMTNESLQGNTKLFKFQQQQ